MSLSLTEIKERLAEEDIRTNTFIEKTDFQLAWKNVENFSLHAMKERFVDDMSIVFLDVDGVLNSTYGFNRSINRDKSELVAQLLDRSGASIVVSSSWRSPPHRRRTLLRVLEEHGISMCKCVGQTPEIDFMNRSNEISMWLDEHPSVTRYCVLDDYDFDWSDRVAPHVVEIDETKGVTQADIERALTVLSALDGKAAGKSSAAEADAAPVGDGSSPLS
eukprot:GEMP01029545.1.p1 GENE.GEMP01029545.1~~GEMP01029545.1.p1  ORF type:complete len:242 (+),score=40.46 GEMP01029545.1:70-726(+)